MFFIKMLFSLLLPIILISISIVTVKKERNYTKQLGCSLKSRWCVDNFNWESQQLFMKRRFDDSYLSHGEIVDPVDDVEDEENDGEEEAGDFVAAPPPRRR